MSGTIDEHLNMTADLLPELVDGVEPRLLVTLLKGDEDLISAILPGFRLSPQTMKMPIVKQRLVREAEKNEQLFQSLTALWTESNQELCSAVIPLSAKQLQEQLIALTAKYGASALRNALLIDRRRSVKPLIDQIPEHAVVEPKHVQTHPRTRKSETDRATALSETLDRIKEENTGLKSIAREYQSTIRDLERRLADSSHRLEQSQLELKAARQTLAEQKKSLDKAEKVSDRARRAKEAAEYEKSLIRRDLKLAQKEIQELNSKKTPLRQDPEAVARLARPDWAPVISRLIKARSYGVARVFCESVVATDPDNLHAHLALEQIYAKIGIPERQIPECLWLAGYLVREKHILRACAFACRALGADPTSQQAQTQFRRIFETVDLASESTVSGARRLLGRLRLSNALAYRQAMKLVRQMGKPHVDALQGPKESLHPDKIFTLSDGKRSIQVSTRHIVEAIDANEVVLVEFVRQSLGVLRKSRPALYGSLLSNLQSQDGSYVDVLTSQTEPVVLDGSNAAWHDNEGGARLQNILDLRTELRTEGYFPIYIYVDASLPYQIDNEVSLRHLIDAGAVIAVDSRTDADEAITNKARTLSCAVVTNDRMADWDPDNSIQKIRFEIDRFGITIYER